MKYIKLCVEFTVPRALETPAREDLQNLIKRIKSKQELTYGRNIHVAVFEDEIDEQQHKQKGPHIGFTQGD